MHSRPATLSRIGSKSAAIAYPSQRDRHPTYMYGTFRARPPIEQSDSLTDEAMLGLREDDAVAAIHAPLHHHADPRQSDSHRFMFGVAPEQSPAPLTAEPAFYFWDVCSA